MKVCSILATCGRHTLLERAVGMFLQQEYQDPHLLLILNNSDVPLTLGMGHVYEGLNREQYWASPSINKIIKLVNNHIDSKTGKQYKSLGAIYNDGLKWVPKDTNVITHSDDDDLFLPNHLLEGIKGLKRGEKIAYKPAKSYYRHPGGLQLMSNTLEPSIFVEASHILEHGYSETTTDQHLQWVNPLVRDNRIFVDETGVPTLIYNWGDTDIPTFKTSGNAGNPQNFDNYRNFSKDHGDRILTPWTREQLQPYYDLVNA